MMRADRSTGEGSTPSKRSAENGFTLVELMIALFIFALLAAAGTALLAFSVRAQGVAAARLDDIGMLSRLASAMSADLAQADARPTRDREGVTIPPFAGERGGSGQPMLRLTRLGWTNLDNAPRPDMQKVEYRLSGGRIDRIAYPMLDGAAPLPPSALIDHVADVALRYRIDGAWSDRWEGTKDALLPQAVELTITRSDGRRYRQLFVVGTDYRPHPTSTGGGNAG